MLAQGGDVLNVGFGLGIIDSAIQRHSPSSHTIIEAHPDVYKYMLSQGWDQRPGVRVVFGRWQDVIDQVRLGCRVRLRPAGMGGFSSIQVSTEGHSEGLCCCTRAPASSFHRISVPALPAVQLAWWDLAAFAKQPSVG